jgi:diguanylate cyclase
MEDFLIPVTNVCTLVTLNYVALKIRNRIIDGALESLAVPFLTGLSSILMMLLPLPTDLIMKDLRYIPILMAGLRFGWPIGLLSVIPPALYTLWLNQPYLVYELLDGLLIPALISMLLHRKDDPIGHGHILLTRGIQACLLLFVFKLTAGSLILTTPLWHFILMNAYMLGITAICVIVLIAMHNDEHNSWLLHRQLELEANHDRMTMLPNFRGFTEIASSTLQKRRISILMIDIDNFKNYNDTLGHLQGDRLLREVGQLLRYSVGEQDYIARYGGEEFVVMCHSTDSHMIAYLAHRLCQTVAEHPFHGREFQSNQTISISIGVSIASTAGDDLMRLISNADQALYASKRNGKNRFTFYELPLEESLL